MIGFHVNLPGCREVCSKSYFFEFHRLEEMPFTQHNTRNGVQEDDKIFSPKVNWFELGLGRAGVIIKAIGLTKGINEFEGTMNRINFFVAEHLTLSIWFNSHLMERFQTTRNVWTKCCPSLRVGSRSNSRLATRGLTFLQSSTTRCSRWGKGGSKRSLNDPISNRSYLRYLAYTNHYFTKMPLKAKMPIKTRNKAIIT